MDGWMDGEMSGVIDERESELSELIGSEVNALLTKAESKALLSLSLTCLSELSSRQKELSSEWKANSPLSTLSLFDVCKVIGDHSIRAAVIQLVDEKTEREQIPAQSA
jgi:hypothetical protein